MGSPLEGSVCVVTGASSGIGRAIARELAERGAHVVLAARRKAALEDVLAECGGRGRVFVCDVSERTQVAALAASVASEEGRCDVLVNNAGVGARLPFTASDETLDRLEQVMATNFHGAAYATASLLPMLTAPSARPATIINMSSIAGLLPVPSASIYCASKFALTGFSESLRAQLAATRARVVTVHPGPIPTPGFEHARLVRSRALRPLWTTDASLARDVARLCERRNPPAAIVRPRLYRAAVAMRHCAPWLYRRAAATFARRYHAAHTGEREQ